MRNREPYTVTQANSYIKNMFLQDYFLKNIMIRGEISNLKIHDSGHIYFSLKDSGGVISAVMFAGSRRGLGCKLQEGMEVVVTGSVEIFEKAGKYQLYAREIKEYGLGELYARYMELKQELEDMGMFDPIYKSPLPEFTGKLGVVTAPTGAAVRDIISVARRRYPGIRIILYPALVQGENAPSSIVRGIKALDEYGVDVMIVGRGGGSIEDLWAFNDRTVADAIFNCSTVVISAVGHETDYTIADFVADFRAPTPSAAAEMAVQDISQLFLRLQGSRDALAGLLKRQLQTQRFRLEKEGIRIISAHPGRRVREYRMNLLSLEDKLKHGMERSLAEASSRLEKAELRMIPLHPGKRVKESRMHLQSLEENLRYEMKRSLGDASSRLAINVERIKGSSPLDKLNQGYAFVSNRDNRPINSVGKLSLGDRIDIYLKDGLASAEILELQAEAPEKIIENRIENKK